MSSQKELEIKMQFLEEATEHLNTLENAIVEAQSNRKIDLQKINAALRAAHSIKGGAAIMGFRSLGDLSHLLEDSFKILKVNKTSLEVDSSLQSLLLSAIDWLRQIVESISIGHDVDEQWITTFCYPVFEELRQTLGEPTPEDAMTIISPEDNPEEIISLLFKTEVEDYLQRLESLLKQKQAFLLREEMVMMSSQLGELGEMLQIPAFIQLCQSIIQRLSTAISDAEVEEIAQLGLAAWRNTQVLLLAGKLNDLPTTIDGNQAEDCHQITDNQQLNLVNKVNNTSPTLEEIRETLPEFTAIPKTENQESTVRVPSKQLEQINDLFGELTIGRNTLRLQLERISKLIRNLAIRVKTLERENHELRLSYEKFSLQLSTLKPKYSQLQQNFQWHNYEDISAINHKFDTLQLQGYNDLNTLSQTVMENILKIQEITGDITLSLEDTNQVNQLLNKTSRKLQNSLTKVRMRPISDIIQRLPKALHNLNLEYSKNVNLTYEGANTLMEPGILEALNEPLMHLLRYALDLGIEDSQTRIAAGKPEQGLIEIKTFHHGDRTIITIRDDGQGIPLEKIRTRAQNIGLNAQMLANARDEDLLSLIFEPGFSTCDEITPLSGMDIVRNNLKLINGEITVDSIPGKGTIFTLSIPFSLSVARIVLVESNGIALAFPTDAVQEICLLENRQILPTQNGKVINWQDSLVELINISDYLQVNKIPSTSSILEISPRLEENIVLIIRTKNQLIAIQADRCWDEQEVTVRRVEGSIPLPLGFNNCTILDNGRIVPLVNTQKLLELIAKKNTLNSISRPFSPTPSPSVKTKEEGWNWDGELNSYLEVKNHQNSILIVDDSVNVRRLLALSLETAGYIVEQAKDGQDALFQLQSGLQVQAIISDIEMPHIDGYNFLIRLKSHKHFQQIPVIMLSSRSSERYRNLAIQLGAHVYLSKPYNEYELLQTLKGVVNNR